MTYTLVTAWLLLVAAASPAQEYDKDSALTISQAAIGTRLDNYRLRDAHGQAFDLNQFRGRPLVVSMIYTSCHHVCPMITRNLVDNVDVAREALGDDAFSVVTIGFDWKVDSPERMRQFAVQQGAAGLPNWRFLAADATTIDALGENLGFLFYPSAKGFDHLAQTTIVDRNGVIYRQLYGVDITTQALVEPLKELVFDTPRRRPGRALGQHLQAVLHCLRPEQRPLSIRLLDLHDDRRRPPLPRRNCDIHHPRMAQRAMMLPWLP